MSKVAGEHPANGVACREVAHGRARAQVQVPGAAGGRGLTKPGSQMATHGKWPQHVTFSYLTDTLTLDSLLVRTNIFELVITVFVPPTDASEEEVLQWY